MGILRLSAASCPRGQGVGTGWSGLATGRLLSAILCVAQASLGGAEAQSWQGTSDPTSTASCIYRWSSKQLPQGEWEGRSHSGFTPSPVGTPRRSPCPLLLVCRWSGWSQGPVGAPGAVQGCTGSGRCCRLCWGLSPTPQLGHQAVSWAFSWSLRSARRSLSLQDPELRLLGCDCPHVRTDELGPRPRAPTFGSFALCRAGHLAMSKEYLLCSSLSTMSWAGLL